MSRVVESLNTVYRVVTVDHDGGVTYIGPYATKGAAAGQATHNDRKDLRGKRHFASVYVEKMTGAWERV